MYVNVGFGTLSKVTKRVFDVDAVQGVLGYTRTDDLRGKLVNSKLKN